MHEFRSYVEPNYHPQYYYPELSLLAAFGPVYIYAPDFEAMKNLNLSPKDFIENVKKGFYRPVASSWYWDEESHKQSPIPWDSKYNPELERVLEERFISGQNYPDVPISKRGWIMDEVAGHFNDFGVLCANEFANNNELFQKAVNRFTRIEPFFKPHQFHRYRSVEQVIESVRRRAVIQEIPRNIKNDLDAAITWRLIYDFATDVEAIAPYEINSPHYVPGWSRIMDDLMGNIILPNIITKKMEKIRSRIVFSCEIRRQFALQSRPSFSVAPQISTNDLKKLHEIQFPQSFAEFINKVKNEDEEAAADYTRRLISEVQRELKLVKSFSRNVTFISGLLGGTVGAGLASLIIRSFPVSDVLTDVAVEAGSIIGGGLISSHFAQKILKYAPSLMKYIDKHKAWMMTYENIINKNNFN